ncbi:MFS transporter [Jatrophihabitans endophyticus]|uniref:MFS transporter n=1 Tax=Jatrophihabitans endophyticus TaxID=1206085 RepID=UPI001A087F27|nr:MFS transporter [Jatrophihabitans endophyticus]MBE7187514.1 MFS transporter [Jatrophihabitans endophyticus]
MTSTTAPSVAARLDRLPIGRTHRVATLVIGLGLFFDAYENFLAATISAVLKAQLKLSSNELNLLLGSAFVGQFLGALVMGRVADRFGRRTAFMINLAIYSVFSLTGALSPNAACLVASRFLAGIGIGAEYALADSYLSDLMPRHARGRYISWAYTVSFLGVPAVGLLARWLVPLSPAGIDGWRILFVIGALGSAAVWVVRRGLPESPRWLELAGRADEADRLTTLMEDEARAAGHVLAEPDPGVVPRRPESLPIASLFRPPFARRSTMLWIMSALEVFGYYGFGTLAPFVLAAKGFDVVTSLGFVAATYAGYPIGSILAVPIVERMERKYLVMGSAALMAAFGVVFGLASSVWLIVLGGLAYTIASNVFSDAYHVYLAESYPTAVRATAAGAAYSLSKLVTGALPFVLLPFLTDHGSVPVFLLVAAAMAVLIVDVALLGERTTGRSADAV